MSKRFYWKKIRPILFSIIICSAFFLILMAITSNRNGHLTIFVNRASVTKSLSLSESKTLSNPQGKIYGPSMDDAWDTTEDLLPPDLYLLDSNNSSNDKSVSYIAYTFYLFNSGIDELDYSMNLNIESVSKNLDEVFRVRLYVNDNLTTYAKKNPTTGEAEAGTTQFEGNNLIASHTITGLSPNEYTKYTLVIWIEGYDQQCTNDKIGGSISLSMKFSVLGLV